MSLLAPAALGLLALLPIIVAMYLLKLRRAEQVVSSIYLWRRMVRDVEANAPWQRLRRNLLLVLQLIFLTAIILALARPFTWAEGASSQAVILIIDTSASMAASDVPPNRLEAAKNQAQQLLNGLPPDARVTLIAAGDRARVLLPSSQDRRLIRQTLRQLQTGSGGADFTTALELASAVAARQPETEIVVFSDGRWSVAERLAVRGQVRYQPVGVHGENQAISLLSLETASAPITSDPTSQSRLSVFIQVTNYGENPAQRRLLLFADGALANAFDLQIPPATARAVVAEDLPGETQVVEARLEGEDALALDDRAWAVHRRVEPLAVTLVSQGNLFLETALALLPGFEVTTVKPADWENNPPQTEPEAARLTIFDAHVPLTATLPASNLLFIAPPASSAYFTVTGTVEQPLPRPEDPSDPLLRHIDLQAVSVLDAVRILLPGWARAVVSGDLAGESVPLLFAGEVDGRRVAVLAFDLHRSDLPLQVAFPLLMSNLAAWLAPGGGRGVPTQVSPGEALTFSLPPQASAVSITRPDGTTSTLLPQGRQVTYADTGQPGVYHLTWQIPASAEEDQSAALDFAVNLFSPQESDLKPAANLTVNAVENSGQAARSSQARREWWRALAAMALVVLTLEWLVYQRGAAARLWAGLHQRVWVR